MEAAAQQPAPAPAPAISLSLSLSSPPAAAAGPAAAAPQAPPPAVPVLVPFSALQHALLQVIADLQASKPYSTQQQGGGAGVGATEAPAAAAACSCDRESLSGACCAACTRTQIPWPQLWRQYTPRPGQLIGPIGEQHALALSALAVACAATAAGGVSQTAGAGAGAGAGAAAATAADPTAILTEIAARLSATLQRAAAAHKQEPSHRLTHALQRVYAPAVVQPLPSALTLAAYACCPAAVAALLQAGNTASEPAGAWTPLHFAVTSPFEGKAAVVRLLLAAGCDADGGAAAVATAPPPAPPPAAPVQPPAVVAVQAQQRIPRLITRQGFTSPLGLMLRYYSTAAAAADGPRMADLQAAAEALIAAGAGVGLAVEAWQQRALAVGPPLTDATLLLHVLSAAGECGASAVARGCSVLLCLCVAVPIPAPVPAPVPVAEAPAVAPLSLPSLPPLAFLTGIKMLAPAHTHLIEQLLEWLAATCQDDAQLVQLLQAGVTVCLRGLSRRLALLVAARPHDTINPLLLSPDAAAAVKYRIHTTVAARLSGRAQAVAIATAGPRDRDREPALAEAVELRVTKRTATALSLIATGCLLVHTGGASLHFLSLHPKPLCKEGELVRALPAVVLLWRRLRHWRIRGPALLAYLDATAHTGG